jgi:large subunit ribosomal protein L18
MNRIEAKITRRQRRKKRVRKSVFGTVEHPRLTVFRSTKHIYAQVIDDTAGKTLCALSTRDRSLAGQVGYGGNKAAAAKVGAALVQVLKEKGIGQVTLDRNGYAYHGRIKALADALREGGIKI